MKLKYVPQKHRAPFLIHSILVGECKILLTASPSSFLFACTSDDTSDRAVHSEAQAPKHWSARHPIIAIPPENEVHYVDFQGKGNLKHLDKDGGCVGGGVEKAGELILAGQAERRNACKERYFEVLAEKGDGGSSCQ